MAVVLDEPEALRLAQAMATAHCLMWVATWVEVGIFADSRGAILVARLDQMVEQLTIEQALTRQQARLARTAYRRHGKNSGSPAKLNLGDTLSYALAVAEGLPQLFVGDGFTHAETIPASY